MKEGFLERIKERKDKLEVIRGKLKEKFVGIDDQINKIIESITLWYLAPEFHYRPTIISLWGTTGIGKTDLVRTLVKLLDFNDKFIEIQMDEKDTYVDTIQKKIEHYNIDFNNPSVLLLDEIQRFRTIDQFGNLLENKYFNDVWMLLSDGKFSSSKNRKDEIVNMILEDNYYADMSKYDKREPEEPVNPSNKKKQTKKTENSQKTEEEKREYKYKTSIWSARRLKKLLKLKLSIEEIMLLNINEKNELLYSALESNEISEGDSYEKMLIIISGNLDEAYSMANDVDNSDLDADIYHEFSKNINIVDIKKALSYKFKPEQIARFGNSHVIYPCLSKSNFQEIIKKRCNFFINEIYNIHNIKINLDEKIYEVIYKNGVFPTQGVRPVLSTISNILDNNIPHFLFIAFENNIEEINIEYENDNLITIVNNKKYSKHIYLDIDNIKNNKSEDENNLVLVHELGHALVYTLLFGIAPSQINLNATADGAGFVMKHRITNSRKNIKNQICIMLSGLVAEELIFTQEFRTNGAYSDIRNATNLAGSYIRSYGMDGTTSLILDEIKDYHVNTDIMPTNKLLESMLNEEKSRSIDLLNNNIDLFKSLIRFSIENKKIEIDEFVKICNKFGKNIQDSEIKDIIIHNYTEKLNKFIYG
jgi:cell division protease FtsH